MMRLPAILLLAATGCTQIDPEQLRQQDEMTCTDAGIRQDSDSFALCMMIQDTNRRLQYIESRLNFLDFNTRRVGRYPYTYY